MLHRGREPAYEASKFGGIPSLAWLLDCSAAMGRPILYHGRHVELFEDGFFEGAWGGDFAQRNFDRSANVFGSGARIGRSAVTFVPPSHTFEPLVQFTGNGVRAVSNSLAFLSAFCNFDLDPIDWRSGERFAAAIIRGLDHAGLRLRLRHGVLAIRFHHNFVLADGEDRQVVAKPLPPRFEDFASYHDYLLNTASDVCANARHDARLRRYEPLMTVASGYDSAAATVIGAALGARDAVSVTTSQRGPSDSGAEVAKALGLELWEYKRVDQVPEADILMAEFLAPGFHGEDYPLHVFQDSLPGRILFTGFTGGRFWGKIWGGGPPPSEKLHRETLGGSSLGEFRLARDFVHLPVPSIGCLRHPDLHRISRSAEMAPYSIGGDYDRPIPRKIVESAGVPRAAFGQRKVATSIYFYRRPDWISQKAHAHIATFEKGLGLSWRQQAWGRLLRLRWRVGLALFHSCRRLTWLRGGRIPPVKALRPVGRAGVEILERVLGPYDVFNHGDPRNAIWHRWALGCVKLRYAAVRTAQSPD
jgi:hypothetical protein